VAAGLVVVFGVGAGLAITKPWSGSSHGTAAEASCCLTEGC
jgi:hypothetical protein